MQKDTEKLQQLFPYLIANKRQVRGGFSEIRTFCNILASTAIVDVKSLTGKEINIIQSGMSTPGREIRRASPNLQEPTNGEKEPDTAVTGATTKLFHRYAPTLFAYLRQHTASREDAEDILHEVFAAAFERPEFGQFSDSEQELWLWRVTRNKTVDTYRHKTRRPSLALDYVADELYAEDEQSPEYALMRREEYADLLAALERLPAIQQEALRLRFVNELPCADVAKALGKREGAVRSILSRAINRLRTIYTSQKEV